MSFVTVALVVQMTTMLLFVLWVIQVAQRSQFSPYPLIGNLPAFLGGRARYMSWLQGAYQYHGRTFYFRIPGIIRAWFTLDPDCVRFVLMNKNESFTKSGHYASITRDYLGLGVLIASGQRHRRHKKAARVLSLSSNLDSATDELLPVALSRFHARVQDAANSNQTSLWHLEATQIFWEVVFRLAFPNTEISMEQLTRRGETLDDAMKSVFGRFTTPFQLWRLFERCIPRSKSLKRSVDDARHWTEDLARTGLLSLEDESEQVDKCPTARRGVVEALHNEGVSKVTEIGDAIRNYISPGRDSTSTSLTWTMYAILVTPHLLTKLQAEVDGMECDIPPIEYSEKLPLLQATIQESLRLYPPISNNLTQNMSGDSVTLPDSTVVGPGQHVVWSPWLMARSTSMWGEDACIFRPERWLEMEEGARPRQWEMPTFSFASRACPGQQLAHVCMLVILKDVISRYDIIRAWGDEPKVVDEGITCGMKGGLEVKFVSRSTSQTGDLVDT